MEEGGSPHGALPLFIGGGDRLGGEGVQICTAWHTPNYSLLTTHYSCTPSPAKLVPSPYKQGESASGLGSTKKGVLVGTPHIIILLSMF